MTAARAGSPPETSSDIVADAARLLDELRAAGTRVHAITNAAAQVLTANLILAVGGTPSLTIAPAEVAAFAARADALVVNLGTLDAERRVAIPWAVATARAGGKPWVLDPVLVDASPGRLAFARLCLAGMPSILRCNAAEFRALSGEDASPDAVAAYARALRTTVAVTGSVDWVSDGERSIALANGDPLMARVTALGCAGAALLGAFAALEPDPTTAAACGLLAIGVAGEIAGGLAKGPGSFLPAFLDALADLDRPTIRARARIA